MNECGYTDDFHDLINLLTLDFFAQLFASQVYFADLFCSAWFHITIRVFGILSTTQAKLVKCTTTQVSYNGRVRNIRSHASLH